MTVYVDDMAAPFKPAHAPGRTYVMCHMMADTEDELHAMADKIGVARRWFQRVRSGNHYDITKSKRAVAVRFGAVEISTREMADVVNQSASPWFFGPRGLVLRHPQPCDFVPAVGADAIH